MDPFEVLGIEPRYGLDLKQVEKRHRELSRALHPDRFVGRASSERRMALSRAIEVNEAWRTVRDPVRRAEALLERAGAVVSEAARQPADPELLMAVMQQREELAEARAEGDGARIEQIKGAAQTREGELMRALGEQLDATSPQREQAMQTLAELRFVRRLIEEASSAEDELT